MSGGAANGVRISSALAPSLPTVAVPDKRRWVLVPGARGLFEPSADFGRGLWMLPRQGPALEDALDGLRHIQPAAAERGVERHHAVPAQPHHHVRTLMAGEVVPHQQQAQSGQMVRQGEAFRQPLLPHLPRVSGRGGIAWLGRCGSRRQDRCQRLFEPAMQDRVGARGDRLNVHRPGRGMEQGQDRARAAADLFVRLRDWLALRLPGMAGMRHSLEWAGLVGAPHRQAQARALRVGPLDQPLFAAASGSVMVTRPSRLRWRTTTPVAHQVRLFCQLKPAACRVRPIV